MADLSPMMKQYLEIKQQHKDEILFYRIGDFYEMFYDDAITASRELDLTLTGKQCGQKERAPMCGVPFHSYETYMARLIAKGYKVAICEQTEDPALAKGLVKREIVRVVTPGTVIESSMLQDDRNNYIASLYLKGEEAGVCFADVSTGTAHVTELKNPKIGLAVIAELCRYRPSEVLFNTGTLACREVTNYIKKHMNCAVELMEDERYAPGLIDTTLAGQFGRDWARSTEIGAEGLVRYAMGGLLQYLHDTQIKGGQPPQDGHPLHRGPVYAPVCRHPVQPGADRDHARAGKAGHPALGAGQDLHRHGQAAAAQLAGTAPGLQRDHQPPPQRGGMPGPSDRRPGRAVRDPALHHRHRAADDPHRLRFGHPQGDLHHGPDLRPASRAQAAGGGLRLRRAGRAGRRHRPHGGPQGQDLRRRGPRGPFDPEGRRRHRRRVQQRGGRAALHPGKYQGGSWPSWRPACGRRPASPSCGSVSTMCSGISSRSATATRAWCPTITPANRP